MKRLNLVSLIVIILAVTSMTIPAIAGTGSIRIDPTLPMGVDSPADFDIWSQDGKDVNDPHVFLVMTEACYDGLMGNVEVAWDGGSVTIVGTDWTKETTNGKKVPPDTTPGAGYTVASLKDHLDTTGAIYWAFKPILEGPLGATKETITVSMESSSPKMLVYILGKSGAETSISDKFDIRVPPTIPGFVVPELPIGAASALLTMIGVYFSKMRKE